MVRGEASRLGQFFLAQERNCLCGRRVASDSLLTKKCPCGFTPRTASYPLRIYSYNLIKKIACTARTGFTPASYLVPSMIELEALFYISTSRMLALAEGNFSS